MPAATLTISFAAEAASASPADIVLLEQEEWGAYAGRLTKLGMTRYLDHMLYASGGGSAPNVVDCGRDGAGDLNTALLVWPLGDDARYRLIATVGTLGAAELGEVEEQDTVSFTLTRSATLKHPAQRVLSAEWLTGPWTTGGVKIAPPPLAASGRELRANVPVYGSVRVRLLARRYRHPLKISWDEVKALVASGGWSEWAVCLPASGRPVALALTMNRGAEDMAQSGGSCGRGGSFKVTGPDEEWPPVAEPEDKTVHCDYCTGECENEDE